MLEVESYYICILHYWQRQCILNVFFVSSIPRLTYSASHLSYISSVPDLTYSASHLFFVSNILCLKIWTISDSQILSRLQTPSLNNLCLTRVKALGSWSRNNVYRERSTFCISIKSLIRSDNKFNPFIHGIFAWLFNRLSSPEDSYLHMCLTYEYSYHWPLTSDLRP